MRALALALALVLTSGPACAAGAVAGSVGRPTAYNVLWIMYDDVSAWEIPDVFSHANPAYPATPTLDSLAQAGVTVDNVASAPVCGAMRALGMSGRYSFRTGIYSFHGQNFSTYELTIPDALDVWCDDCSERGAFGKFGLQAPGADITSPGLYGFHRFRGHVSAAISNYVSWDVIQLDATSRDPGDIVVSPDPPETTTVNATANAASEMLTWLTARRAAGTGRPWFAWLTLTDAHTPAYDPPGPPGNSCGLATAQDCYKAQIVYADQQAGLVISDLAANDELARTLVIWTGENGGLYPMDAGGGKFSWKESGVNVGAILAHGPVLNPGRTETDLYAMVDMLPTIVSAMGRSTFVPPNHPDSGGAEPGYVGQTRHQDGVTMWPLIRDDAAATGHAYVLTEDNAGTHYCVRRAADAYKFCNDAGTDALYLLPGELVGDNLCTDATCSNLTGAEAAAHADMRGWLVALLATEGVTLP